MAVHEIDVVVVLGSGLTPSGQPTERLRRRMRRGVELLAETGANALLLTGGPPGARVTEAAAMRDFALSAGVAAERIVLEPAARDTFENARFCVRIMSDLGWSHPVIVSDRVHLPRALLSFRWAGVRARAEGVAGGGPPFRSEFHHLLYEAVGLAWYLVRIAASAVRR
jgi:uncharacterized SAM-binding protein YcdF (DUF218 family)